jgi:N-acetylglucosamine-6-sulfatase
MASPGSGLILQKLKGMEGTMVKIPASTLRAALLVVLLLFQAGSPACAKPPNIVFILADDLNQEVLSHAHRIHALLTAKGIRFENHFVSLSLCCPSRVAMLRGQFAHNTGIYGNKWPAGGFGKVYRNSLESSTAAVWLQSAGYRTALFGKYLNGYPSPESGRHYIPPGWNHWVSPNGGTPYSEYGYTLNENGKTAAYGHGDADYLVDVLSRKAAAFIRDTVAKFPDRPFFAYVAPYIPHGPATPPARYANDFPGLKAPRTAAFNEADMSDKPAWLRAKQPLDDAQIAAIDGFYRRERQSMQAVEDLVQNLVDTLTAVGELDRTYIFFTSDNGLHQGQHRLNTGKNTAFEEDVKVPLVVRGPGVPMGAVVRELTANVDFAPTWAEIAGATAPSFVDGRSLASFLAGARSAAWRRVLLLEHGGPSLTPRPVDGLLEPQDPYDVQATKSGGAPVFAGLRTGNGAVGSRGPLTYVEYDTGERELYDLATDPAQLLNIVAVADPALGKSLNAWLASLRGTSGAALRRAEENPP